jgi:hypothetical protein
VREFFVLDNMLSATQEAKEFTFDEKHFEDLYSKFVATPEGVEQDALALEIAKLIFHGQGHEQANL